MTIFKKYNTVEVKEFALEPEYSGDPFSEHYEFTEAKSRRDKAVSEYISDKVGNDYELIDYPARMTVATSTTKRYFHIQEAYYSADGVRRVLVSKTEEIGKVLIFQRAQNMF